MNPVKIGRSGARVRFVAGLLSLALPLGVMSTSALAWEKETFNILRGAVQEFNKVATAPAPSQQANFSSKAAVFTGDFSRCLNQFAHQTPPKIYPLLTYEGRESFPLCFDGFATLTLLEGKATIFSAEHLTPARIAGADEKRTDKFYEEARLPSRARASLSAYRSSGWDRGHLSAAANQESASAMAQSFSLANMAPQLPELNRGAWAKQAESDTRKYVTRARTDVYVITGTHFESGIGKASWLNGELAIPSHWFKLVYTPATNRAWVFWANNSAPSTMARISYEALVVRTQTEWLPGRNPGM